MKKLHYEIEIQAKPEQVYDTLLGLTNKKTYQQWTKAFSPPSANGEATWEGSWDKGSKILFVSIDENGKKGGMVSRIAENIPGKFVSIQHTGIVENDIEITEGPKVEGWANGFENYSFEPVNIGTLLSVEMDMKEDYVEYFNEAWPKALEALKTMCEESGAKTG